MPQNTRPNPINAKTEEEDEYENIIEKIRDRTPPTIRIRDKVFTKRIFCFIATAI